MEEDDNVIYDERIFRKKLSKIAKIADKNKPKNYKFFQCAFDNRSKFKPAYEIIYHKKGKSFSYHKSGGSFYIKIRENGKILFKENW